MKKIGFIINPVAGLGGRAGFKGSDLIENQKRALEMGYEKLAPQKAKEFLSQINTPTDAIFFTAPDEMGAHILDELGFRYQIVSTASSSADTTSATVSSTYLDTIQCVQQFITENVDVIIFCGGDGTARDVCKANVAQIPVLGIPAGVKMYSSCFGINPRIAGTLLNHYLLGRSATIELREVMDIDEEILGIAGNSPKLYGYLPTLNEGAKLQGSKVASSTTFQEADILAEYMAENMKSDTLYLIGPGSTTYKIKETLGIDGTLLGVDVVNNRKLIAKDANEQTILSLLSKGTPAKIIVTCIGGSGFVFGRGNQQISAKVIKQVGKENIQLAVTKSKLAGLWQRPMHVDTGDKEVDEYLSGYYRIDFNKKESAMYKISM
ncbi:MAG: ATP-NAD kinase family protein [Dorea sp.]